MRFLRAGGFFCLFVVICQTAIAQEQIPEFLHVDGFGDETVWVTVRAHGRGSRDRDWQPLVKSTPGNRLTIRLRGYEPFDVLIYKKDGTFIRLDRVNLCEFMQYCEVYGPHAYLVPITVGTWKRGQDGNAILDDDEDVTARIAVGADATNVGIDVSRVEVLTHTHDPPRPPRRPPQIPE